MSGLSKYISQLLLLGNSFIMAIFNTIWLVICCDSLFNVCVVPLDHTATYILKGYELDRVLHNFDNTIFALYMAHNLILSLHSRSLSRTANLLLTDR